MSSRKSWKAGKRNYLQEKKRNVCYNPKSHFQSRITLVTTICFSNDVLQSYICTCTGDNKFTKLQERLTTSCIWMILEYFLKLKKYKGLYKLYKEKIDNGSNRRTRSRKHGKIIYTLEYWNWTPSSKQNREKKLRMKYLWRTRKLLETEVCKRNPIKYLHVWPVHFVWFSDHS